MYVEIFEGRKICGFGCKFAERKILILKKKQWLNETMYTLKLLSDFSAKYVHANISAYT